MSTPRNLSKLAENTNSSGVLGIASGGTGGTTTTAAKTSLGLHEVATTGSYADLANKPTTTQITEGTNLYFTDARARAAISASGSLSYNSSTGVLSYTTPSTSGITEGSNLYFTDSRARGSVSASGSLSYNSTTGVFSYTTPSTSGIAEGTNLYYTDARAISANTSAIATAKSEAIASAATDATTKANAAQAAAIAAVTNGAGAAFDTLKEIQDAMATDQELAAAIAGLTIGNATQTISAGTGLSGGGSFTANQTSPSTVTLSLATAGTAGTYTKVTTDAYGRVTSGTTLSAGDIPSLSGSYLPLSGGTLTGNISFAQGANINFGTSTNEAGPWTISVIGSGGATPATKGTGRGRNLIIQAGASDNGAGLAGGDMFVRGGNPTSPSVVYGDVRIADLGGQVYIRSGEIALGSSNYSSYALPLTGGTLSGGLIINAGGGYPIQTTSNQRYQIGIKNTSASAQTQGWWFAHDTGGNLVVHADSNGDKVSIASSGFGLQVGVASTYDNPGGWNANLVASGTNHARVRVKGTSYNSSGDNEAYLWVDNTVGGHRTGLYSSTNFNINVPNLYESGSRVLNSSNYNNYSPTLTGGNASGTWAISITGNSATTSQRAFSGDISTTGQGRFTGWHAGGAATGLAVEVGISGSEGYILSYNRNTSSYGTLNLNATNIRLDPQGGTLTGPGGNAILHAGNYNSYSPTLTGGGASGTWAISITGSANYASSAGEIGGYRSDGWLRKVNDNTQFQMYGNTHTMIYRTDGVTNPHGGGGYAHIFYYGGSNNEHRAFIINTDGRLYSPYHGWLDTMSVAYASSAGTADQIDGIGFRNTASNSSVNADSLDSNGITYYTAGVPNFTGNATDGALYSQAYSSSWQHQIAGDYRSGQIALRGKNNGTWQSWRTVLDSSNYSSYSLPLSGGTMSGRLTISPGWTTSGRNYSNEWIEFGNYSGLYSPQNGAHFYPNNGSYGGWRSAGSRNGWHGIEFDSSNGNTTLMIGSDGNTSGFHNNNSGWQFRWASGELHVYKNSYGGGTDAIALDSSNYSSYALPLSGGTLSGAIRAPQITAGGSTNTDANLGVQGSSHFTGTIYYGGTVGNVNSWSSISTSSSGTHTFSGSRFVFDRYGYGSQPLITLENGAITLSQPTTINGATTINSILNVTGNSIKQGNDLARPLASWGSSGATGMVIFKLPGSSGNYGMVHMVFDIYEYNSNSVSTVIIGGHNWASGWYNTGANVIGQLGKQVRLGYVDGQYCIVFGDASSYWEYGQIVFRKIQNGAYYTNVMDLGGSYPAYLTTSASFTNISGDLRALRTPASFNAGGAITQAGNQVLHAGNINSYIPSWSTGVNGSHLVQRDGNGYIYANHINFNTTESENPSINSFITSNGDGWSRKSSLAHVKNSIRGVADGTWGISITGSASTASGLPTYYAGGQQTNPQVYFNENVGLRVAMTGAPSVWSDTLWINGYAGGDVPNMCALHTIRNGTPRMWISTQSNRSTSYGTYYEFLSTYNYNSYSPTLTGGNASGTWSINITGSAGGLEGYAWMTSGKSVRVNEVYADGWLRNYNSNTGLYNQETANHWYSDGQYWNVGMTGSTRGIRLRNGHAGSVLGYLYAESDANFGLLHNGGGWAVQVYNGGGGYLHGTWNGGNIRANRANGNLYIDDNYGNGVVGVYASTRYQGVFFMGDSYKMSSDGTSLANMYGIGWSHPNAGGAAGNLTDHGMLIINNGGFRCAISNSIVASGNITAYSDERLKTNWRDMPDNYVSRLAEVKVGIYDRIDETEMSQVGVSAQSLQKLLPEAIMTAKDEMQTLSVNYGSAALASAVELAKHIVKQDERIARLEALIQTLLKDKA
jgi:predicted RecA/RadA family phage recombinase